MSELASCKSDARAVTNASPRARYRQRRNQPDHCFNRVAVARCLAKREKNAGGNHERNLKETTIEERAARARTRTVGSHHSPRAEEGPDASERQEGVQSNGSQGKTMDRSVVERFVTAQDLSVLIMRRLVRLVEWVPFGRWLKQTLQILEDGGGIVERKSLEAIKRIVATFGIHFQKKPVVVIRDPKRWTLQRVQHGRPSGIVTTFEIGKVSARCR